MKTIREEHFNKNLNANVIFLGNLLSKTDGFVQHLDTQTNILLGISSAIFLFSASQAKDSEWSVFFLIICIFSAAATLISLLSIHPPQFMRKRNQEESIMYNKTVASFDSADDYIKKIKELLSNEDEINKQTAIEIFNLCKYYYRPKRKLFNLARNILISGLFIALVAFIIDIVYIKLK